MAAGADEDSRGVGCGQAWLPVMSPGTRRNFLKVEAPLAGLLQVPSAGLKGAQQIEAAQGVAGQWRGDLGDLHD